MIATPNPALNADSPPAVFIASCGFFIFLSPFYLPWAGSRLALRWVSQTLRAEHS